MINRSKLASILEDEGLIKTAYEFSGLKSLSRSDLDAGPSKWEAIYPEMFYREDGTLGSARIPSAMPSQHRRTVFYVSKDQKHLVAYNGKKAYLRGYVTDSKNWDNWYPHQVAEDTKSTRSIERDIRDGYGEWMPLSVT